MSEDRSGAASGPLARVLPGIGGMATVERLAQLSGSDFTSVMLEVMRRRAARETPASVLRRYRQDRFVRPGAVPWWSVRHAEDLLLGCLPGEFEVVTVAPLVPLGTHSVLGALSQHRVVSAVRACEVAADPTNALALEAAVRRAQARDAAGAGSRAPLPDTPVRLAALQRAVRAQQLQGPGYFAHFGLFALVTDGRDRGGHRFERAAVAEQVRFAVRGLAAVGLLQVQLALTPLSAAGQRIAAGVAADLGDTPVEIIEDSERQAGRGYYRELCFKINAWVQGQPEEIGDGGFTDWGMRLTANAKERLLISGLGMERLAAFASAAA